MIQTNVDTFWNFMIERENIRLRRLRGQPWPWSQDEIFQTYSFTNVKRHHDRVTTLLDREFYAPRRHLGESTHPSPTRLLNAAIFRFHGTVETARVLGWHGEWSDVDRETMIRKNALRSAMGEKIFTGSYIIPSCGISAPKHEVVAQIVDEVWKCAEYVLDCNDWETACHRLKVVNGIGSFMAKEILLDYILATSWEPEDWQTWTPVGPGARRGAGWIVNNLVGGIPEDEALSVIRMVYADRAQHWPRDLVTLDLTDIQFQFCELSKMVKARTGIGAPKRRFHPTIDDVTRRTP